MQLEIIHFENKNQAKKVRVVDEAELHLALKTLDLITPTPVVVLVGGAAGVNDQHAALIQDVSNIIAQVVEETNAAIIDGGTQSGVMASIGRVRNHLGYQFPLIGVAVEQLVNYPGLHDDSEHSGKKGERYPLDLNHTHFILVPGTKWGDESSWISQAAKVLSGEYPSVTILINGGEISREDVKNSLKAERPVLVLQGTGRLADELAEAEGSSLMRFIRADDEKTIYKAIEAFLRR
jgi:hypothetical protein